MFFLENTIFTHEPYPIGVAHNVLSQDYYEQLVENFPPKELFLFIEHLGNKYSLSEVNNQKLYHDYVMSYRPWREFYQWVKSKDFIYQVLEMLCRHNIDLGLLSDFDINKKEKLTGFKNQLRLFLKNFKYARKSVAEPSLSARFEFSMLPANEGHIKPHTDNPQKIITLVFSVFRDGEWDSSFGGGTEVMKPRDITKNFNYLNKQLEFDEVETVKTFDYYPNQCVVFIKTFNSLHAVRPMTGYNSSLMRKTLTINIEKKS